MDNEFLRIYESMANLYAYFDKRLFLGLLSLLQITKPVIFHN